MQDWLEGIEAGAQYVQLDTYVIPRGVEGVRFDGQHAHHELDYLPHERALTDPSVLTDVLKSVDYWTKRRLPDDE